MSPIDFSRLEKKAQTINKQSDELTAAISAINEKLNSLNLGIEIFSTDNFDYQELGQELQTDRYLGYGKLGTKWGIIVRTEQSAITSRDNYGDANNWNVLTKHDEFLLSSPRQIRMKAIDNLQGLIDALEKEADKLEASVAKAKEISKNL